MTTYNGSIYTNSEFQTVVLCAVKSNNAPDITKPLFKFPVPHQKMTVRCGVKMQSDQVAGASGSKKGAAAYEDAEVTIELLLNDEYDNYGKVKRSAYDQLSVLKKAFKSSTSSSNQSGKKISPGSPKIYGIKSRLTDAMGLKTVIFKDIAPSDVPGETGLVVNLSFVEYESVAKKKEKQASKTAGSTAQTGFTSTGLNDYQSLEKLYSDEDTEAKEAFYRDVNWGQAEREKMEALIKEKIGADGVPYPWGF